jgi:hypothetical protein
VILIASTRCLHNRACRRAQTGFRRLALTVLNGRAAQIFALQFDKVEGDQHTASPPCRLWRIRSNTARPLASVTMGSPSIRNERAGSAATAAAARGANIRTVEMTYRQYQWVRIKAPQNPKFWAPVPPTADQTAILSDSRRWSSVARDDFYSGQRRDQAQWL